MCGTHMTCVLAKHHLALSALKWVGAAHLLYLLHSRYFPMWDYFLFIFITAMPHHEEHLIFKLNRNCR